jgi:large subunit ribosomal protein L23
MGFFKKQRTENREQRTDKNVSKKSVEPKAKSQKPKAKKPKKDSRNVPSRKPKKTTTSDLSWVLLSSRITERAAHQSEQKIYVFNVHMDANKEQVKEAIAKKFDVMPLRVNISKIPSKPVFRKGVWGKKAQGKKAYVYLSKNDSIQFV